MSRFGTRKVGDKLMRLKKDGSLGKEIMPKKSSKDLEVTQTRSELDTAAPTRAPRVHRGAGRALDVPEAVQADIEAKDCVCRWVVDENARVQIFLDDWWDIYRDAQGKDVRVMAGSGKNGQGVYYVLMIQKKSDHAETIELKRQKVAGTLEAQQVLEQGKVPDYLPDGQSQVIDQVPG